MYLIDTRLLKMLFVFAAMGRLKQLSTLSMSARLVLWYGKIWVGPPLLLHYLVTMPQAGYWRPGMFSLVPNILCLRWFFSLSEMLVMLSYLILLFCPWTNCFLCKELWWRVSKDSTSFFIIEGLLCQCLRNGGNLLLRFLLNSMLTVHLVWIMACKRWSSDKGLLWSSLRRGGNACSQPDIGTGYWILCSKNWNILCGGCFLFFTPSWVWFLECYPIAS